jgi:hypothetical protein
MDKLEIACKGVSALLSNLKRCAVTIPDLKILMALNLHGEQGKANLMIQAGFSTPNQSHLTRLVKLKMIDVVSLPRPNGAGQKKYGYNINHIGLTALKKALKEITG